MPKRLALLLPLLLSFALASCVTEQKSALPMALAPGDAGHGSCLTYGNAPAYGDCEGSNTISLKQGAN
jgi:hypothetical protein